MSSAMLKKIGVAIAASFITHAIVVRFNLV